MLSGMLIACSVILMVIAMCYRTIVLKKREQKRLQQGIVLTLHLKRIIESCQKHRGTSNMLSQRRYPADKQQLLVLQSDIDSLIGSQASEQLTQFPQWHSFTEHWPRLKRHAINGDLQSDNLVRQHSIMIDGHLSLLDEIMRDHQLHGIYLDQQISLSTLCLNSLRVAETIGQTRAVGSGICASGYCSDTDTIVLDFLKMTVDSTVNELIHTLTQVNNTELNRDFLQASTAIKTATGRLIQMIDEQVLNQDRRLADANDYFNLSTKAIDEVLKVFGIAIHYASKQHIQMI